jgi:hypothetical protein
MDKTTRNAAIGLAVVAVGAHVYDSGTFKDAPPLASVPMTATSTLGAPTGPAGPAYRPVVTNAVTDEAVTLPAQARLPIWFDFDSGRRR